MIELTLTEMAIGVVVAAFLLVVAFAMLSRWSNANGERRSLRSRVICRLCGWAFDEPRHVKIPECPQCGAKNQHGRDRRLG